MVSEIEAAFHAYGVDIQGDELQQAIAIAVERCAENRGPAGGGKLGDHC
jgi:hypothetical protein